jgi:hypothetical protein
MIEGWSDFFVAVAGAGSALAGLIIVAMSVNIQRIVEFPALTNRGAATVGLLILVVVSAAAGLIPEQPLPMLGVEILVFGLGAAVLVLIAARAMRADVRQRSTLAKIALLVMQVLPFLIGAVVLLTGAGAGLYWVAGGIVLVFIGSTANAWVLLVEILR